jgi:hypothetical protein
MVFLSDSTDRRAFVGQAVLPDASYLSLASSLLPSRHSRLNHEHLSFRQSRVLLIILTLATVPTTIQKEMARRRQMSVGQYYDTNSAAHYEEYTEMSFRKNRRIKTTHFISFQS